MSEANARRGAGEAGEGEALPRGVRRRRASSPTDRGNRRSRRVQRPRVARISSGVSRTPRALDAQRQVVLDSYNPLSYT